MKSRKFNARLTGFVGYESFSERSIQKILDESNGNPVSFMISSQGGFAYSGLAISAAFRQHGKVDVHLSGCCASAATVAAMGAAKITMDRDALFLVHKASSTIFKWESMNSDKIEDFIKEVENIRYNLGKIDEVTAAMYARKCKKSPEDLIELMSQDNWLTAKEALEWGFIDEITSYEDESPVQFADMPVISYSLKPNKEQPSEPKPEESATEEPEAVTTGEDPHKKSSIRDFFNLIRNFFCSTSEDPAQSDPETTEESPAQEEPKQEENNIEEPVQPKKVISESSEITEHDYFTSWSEAKKLHNLLK